MIDCDRVRELIDLVSDRSIKDHGTSKIKALYGDDANNLATTLIYCGLFLENLSLLAKISRDSWKIYSHIPNRPKNDKFDNLSEGILNESLIKLVKAQPMNSYLRLSFRQVMNFILSRSKSNQLIDMPYLMSYMNELRTSYETLCTEDRLALKPSKAGCTIDNFVNDSNSDASFLVGWTLIEGAKHIICHKFAPDMTATEFLNLLQKEISAPVAFGDKISRRFLVTFLENLDKFILDRILESSTSKHTFGDKRNIEQFYEVNSYIFDSWLLKNRQNIARLSLTVDNPAECWRNANLRLCLDLTTKYQGSSSPNRKSSLSQTLMSLNTKNWHSNLSLLTSSAKQLEDLSLLYGIQAMADHRGIICEYPPLKAMIFNLEGRHQQTYDLLKDSMDLDQQSLAEFLNACNELNLLEMNQDYIEKLNNGALKTIYKKYVESKSQNKIPKFRQEETEIWLNTWSDMNELNQIEPPIREYMDLVVQTNLNIIVNVPEEDRAVIVERTEWLISQDFIAQCLFPPSFINKNIKVYHVILDLLKGKKDIDKSIVETHANDLYWNHSLYRHLCNLDLITNLRKQSSTIDFVQFRAAKYSKRHDNKTLASRIAQDLIQNASSDNMRIRSSLILLNDGTPSEQSCDALQKVAMQIRDLNSEEYIRNELASKALRQTLRLSSDPSKKELNILHSLMDKDVVASQTDETILEKWQYLLDMPSSISNAKTLLLLSKRLNNQLSASLEDDKLLRQTQSLDLKLLKDLCQSDLSKHKASALDCAARILQQIVRNHSRLNPDNLHEFRSFDFLRDTINIWILLKTNLISIISYKDDLAGEWREALIEVVKHIGQTHPNILIYSIIVNRLDLQNELNYLNDESTCHIQDPCSILLQNNCSSEIQEPSGKLRDCKRKLAFWSELFEHIKASTQSENRWPDMVTETERFLKEIRKISFLCGEYLKTLTVKIPKKLYNFTDYFRKLCDTGMICSQQSQEECYKRLKTTCDQASYPIKALLCYSKKIGETNLSKYDKWFCETFSKHLRELEYRLTLLAKKKPIILNELTMLVKSITELLVVCGNILREYKYCSRQKLYMEMISPLLSRLEPSLIPMPDCCNEPSSLTKPLVFIHKISQTVNLIVSKTSPKKLKFIGSDGLSRSFLLKAHEDLRLDQLIMDLFASINNLFLGREETRNKFRIRRYSVTPVSTRSGLIQWVEAPSLCSSYRAWLNGPNGEKVLTDFYGKTCKVLCKDSEPRPGAAFNHTHCVPSENIQSTDPFYQLLWAKTKSKRIPLTQVKPFFGNIIKYRAEFDNNVFQSIVEQLETRMPNDLLTNQLWYMSNNSHSYWLKTQEFVRSCAAMSIVGYIIGLGDRHLENILLDHSTGEVIHIDYNICFEMGKTLAIPEQVPFRLTQNIIHAFGFAGLEGGFKISCRNVLNALKECKSTLLHLLDPINLKFMISQQSKTEEMKDRAARISLHRLSSEVASKMAQIPKRSTEPVNSSIEVDMCSQESVELKPPPPPPPPPVGDLNDLLTLNLSSVQGQALVRNRTTIHHSFDFQHNIKTPTKILDKTATNIYERCRDKLSGTDECIRHYNYQQEGDKKQSKLLDLGGDTSSRAIEQPVDLIVLNDAQTTDEQVDALIMEATSMKNKSAMFEGWVPWI